MNTEYSTPSGKSFWPLVLLSLSIATFLLSDLKTTFHDRDEIQNSKQKMQDFVAVNIPRLDSQVDQAKKAEDVLQSVVVNLLEIAKTDESAKAIVQKYGIKQQTPPSGSSAPSSTP